MYLPETHIAVNHQKFLDRLHEVEQQRLLKIAGWQSVSSRVYRRTGSWLGTQLVNWGAKLQQYNLPQNPDIGCQETSVKITMTVH
jgi:hypothetical protein